MQPKIAVCITPFSTLNCRCCLLSKKNPIIRIFRMSGRLVVPIIPHNRSYTVIYITLQKEFKVNFISYDVCLHILALHIRDLKTKTEIKSEAPMKTYLMLSQQNFLWQKQFQNKVQLSVGISYNIKNVWNKYSLLAFSLVCLTVGQNVIEKSQMLLNNR
jgi:hypothetical protein